MMEWKMNQSCVEPFMDPYNGIENVPKLHQKLIIDTFRELMENGHLT